MNVWVKDINRDVVVLPSRIESSTGVVRYSGTQHLLRGHEGKRLERIDTAKGMLLADGGRLELRPFFQLSPSALVVRVETDTRYNKPTQKHHTKILKNAIPEKDLLEFL